MEAPFRLVTAKIQFKKSEDGVDFADEPIETRVCAIGQYDASIKQCVEWDDQIFYWFADENDIKDAVNNPRYGDFQVIEWAYMEGVTI